jgi:hypothetical protein
MIGVRDIAETSFADFLLDEALANRHKTRRHADLVSGISGRKIRLEERESFVHSQ